jgi:Ca-activated chloride channel homolog
MTLTWPWALVLLLLLPVFIVGYRRLLARQAVRREALARQGLVQTPQGGAGRLRHVAPTLILCGFAVLMLAVTRPVAQIGEPRREGTVILAFDVSTSMSATDVKPSRLKAATDAARAFIEKQPPDVRIGIVAFGGSGTVAARPTTDQAAVVAAVDRLRAQGDTSLGSAILTSLTAIAGKPIALPPTPTSGVDGGGDDQESPIGRYPGTVVVLLTDGEDTGGADPIDAAELASAAGVRVDAIGLGTAAGTVIQVDGFSVATSLDEEMLKKLATTTGGTYRTAADASALAAVYDSIDLSWQVRTTPHEVTSLLAGLAALLLGVGATISVFRDGRVI